MGHVMVGEVLHGNFTLTNKSDIDLQYSNSLLSEKFSVVQGLSGDSSVGKLGQGDSAVGELGQGDSSVGK